jgi:hypothetical protein
MSAVINLRSIRHMKTLSNYAASSGYPVTLNHNDEAKTIEVFLPNGESILCVSVSTLPRNRSHFVNTDAIRHPATLMEVQTDMAHCWFIWQESALHGQFHTREDALQFIAA